MTRGRAPDFLVIGAARSGTSALASFLAEHPDVFVSDPKEPHFLALNDTELAFSGPGDDRMMNTRAVLDPDAWMALFDKAGHRKAGEGSVSTLYYHERSIPTIERFLAADAPLFVMLRDPVERAYSSYLYMVSRGHETMSFADALEDEPRRIEQGWHHIWHYRRMGRYEAQLGPFVDRFGDRVHVTLFEDFNADSQRHLGEIFERIGVRPDVQIETSRDVNRGGVPRFPMLVTVTDLLRRSSRVRNIVRAATGDRLRERVRAANLHRPDMPQEIRARLVEDFAPTRTAVEQIIGRPTPWKRDVLA